ncbi:MAG: bifunctional oligoribonuclease/PAP phosphatase NrnA [Eubacterium sp.]|nr:bifunctional oligoribonuclease/PAP phosphatase NrnA [Eubacterium sp.]
MRIDVKKCAALLKEQDNILILTHSHPDGDTLGCGFGLCRALIKMGKKARVINADEIPAKYSYLYNGMPCLNFKENYVAAVDVATENLLGSLADTYSGRINLCIDHHGTNTEYADNLYLRETASACELVYEVITELGVQIDKEIANCLFTGISTDTGCFRYASVTASTFRIAADLLECGADNGYVNRVMFETKTKTYARLERLAIDSMRLYCNDKVAIMKVTQEMYKSSGSNEQETEALAPLTRQVEGVEIGITIREKPDGTCKASFRTFETVNAAELAKLFGGGGHPQAAACRLDCSVDEAVELIVQKCGELVE